MSEENIEVVREAIEAWNARDMERLRDVYDPDAIVRGPPDWPERGPLVGRDAIFRGWSEMRTPRNQHELTFAYTVRSGLVFELEVFRDHGEALEAVGLRD